MNLQLTPTEMLAGFGALVVLVVAWRASARAARRAVETARAGARLMSLAGRVVVTAAVLAAVQWIVLSHAAGHVTLVAVALGAPDLLAGYTLTRALTVTTSDPPRRRGGRR
jgi:hypothetical protein